MDGDRAVFTGGNEVGVRTSCSDASSNEVERRTNLEILFDSRAAELRHASVAACSVTQDIVFRRFDEEASTDDTAGESTREPLQLLLPWDVGLAHARSSDTKGTVEVEGYRDWKGPRPASMNEVAAKTNE